MPSGNLQQQDAGFHYYLPVDYVTTLQYIKRGRRRGKVAFDRMYHFPDDREDIDLLASLIDENSPQFAKTARENKEWLETLGEQFPEYR